MKSQMQKIKFQRFLKKFNLTPFRELWFLVFICLITLQINAQTAPFQMPTSHNEGDIYNALDFYNFSSVAFDSQNRPYGFNIHEEFGYIRTLRNGVWKKLNYLDELQVEHAGKTISPSTRYLTNQHHDARISLTSDNHLYMVVEYRANSTQYWALLYLDDLNTDTFQVFSYQRSITSKLVLEAFTGQNLKNGETPTILAIDEAVSFATLGWPAPTVTWTAKSTYSIKVLVPFRNASGLLEFNTTDLGGYKGTPTIHSGGDAIMATKGNKTYIAFPSWNIAEIESTGARNNVNQGYIAEVIRPASISGTASVTTKYMGIASVYNRIDSHSQGELVLDAAGKLHYFAGNHAAKDEYWRTNHSIDDPQFDFSTDWTQYGTTTPDGDFSYDTPVIDDNNIMHFAYRQRNPGPRAKRGLYVKTATTTTTNWGTGLGSLIVKPPSPWDTNYDYIVFYHRLVMDRANNPHLTSGFYERTNGINAEYPRINAFRPNGNGAWKMPDRYTYLENIINGKTIQRISFSIADQVLGDSPITLTATSDATNVSMEYEVINGHATVSGNLLTLTGTGQVTIKAKNSGNATFYGDETIQTFKTTTNLNPEADAFVRDGGSANNNYGSSTGLAVKTDGINSGVNRQTYLRFDLSSIQGIIINAKLKLVPNSSGAGIGNTTIKTKFVSTDTWTETGITWNNKPTTGSVLDNQTGSASALEWDVTAQAETERTGDGLLSLALESTVPGSDKNVNYRSRESSNASLRPQLIITLQPSTNLLPEADAFVRDGGSANNNYGSSTGLAVKTDGTNSGFNRQTYLRFDLSSVQGTITSAKLKLVPNSSGAGIGNTTIQTKFVSTDTWTEAGITWNNKPTTGDVLDNQTGSASALEWDVTAQAETERTGDGLLSLALESTVPGSDKNVNYRSRESSNTSLRPQLIITVLPNTNLLPEADAFVRDGGSANNNYGSSAGLTVKSDGINSGFSRQTYLRFDLSSVQGTITSAKLKLVPSSSGAGIGNTTIQAKFVSTDTWTESGITWSNKPTSGSVLDSKIGSATITEWDVTAQAETERAGDGLLSLALESTVPGSDKNVSYISKETAINYANRPLLIITTSGGTSSSKTSSTKTTLSLKNDIEGVKINPTVYPNPFNEYVKIVSPNEIQSYQVYNILGKLLLSSNKVNNKTVEINMTSLIRGTYILKILDKGKSISNFRIVK